MLPTLDSPLRRIPNDLNNTQSLFLDGIRCAIEMCDIGYGRLTEKLLQYSAQDGGKSEQRISHAELFLDAWSFVDSMHRLRELVGQMPGVKHNSAGIQQFLRKTAQVETLRHIAQHLRREVTAIAEMNQPIHGILSWLFLVDTQRATWRSCSAAAGKLRNMAPFKFPNPVNRASSDVLDHIELWIKNTQFSISEAYVELKGFTRSLEKGLPQAWSSYDCLGADTFISLDIVVPSKRI